LDICCVTSYPCFKFAVNIVIARYCDDASEITSDDVVFSRSWCKLLGDSWKRSSLLYLSILLPSDVVADFIETGIGVLGILRLHQLSTFLKNIKAWISYRLQTGLPPWREGLDTQPAGHSSSNSRMRFSARFCTTWRQPETWIARSCVILCQVSKT
jgi:hypothetical protein